MNRVFACLGDPSLGLAGLVLVIALALTSTGGPDRSGAVDFEGTSATAPVVPAVPVAPPAFGPGETHAPEAPPTTPTPAPIRLLTNQSALADD